MEKDGELVEVIAHDPSGRIKKYLKTPVSRNDVVALRAQARVHAEEAECAAAIKEANALIERARDPQPTHAQLVEKAKRPSTPAPAPMPAPASAPTPQPLPSPSPAAAVVIHQHVVAPQPTHRALPASVPKRQTHQSWVNEIAEKARLRKQKMKEPKSSPSPAVAAAQSKAAEEHKAIVAKIGYSIGQQMFEIVAKSVPEGVTRFGVDATWFDQVAKDTLLDLVKRGRIDGTESDISTFYLALRLGLDAEIANRKFRRAEETAT
jgi:hypothetical protein